VSLAGTVPWPEDLAAAYRRAGWWRGQALGTEVAAVARARPEAIALVDGTTRISYGSLLARADALATRLTGDLGLERGDRIVVQLPNAWPFAVLTLGCLRAGIIPVMALPAHREHELAWLCRHGEARALAVPGVLRGFDHQDLAARLRATSATLEHVLVAAPDVAPGHHDLTALCAEPPAPGPAAPGPAAGGPARWDAAPPAPSDVAVFLLSGGTTEGVTITAAVPAVAQRWLAHAAEHGNSQLRTLEVLQVGGARLADELARRVRPVLGATLQQVFGMAEGLLNYTRLDDPGEVICGTQGRPLSPGDEVRITGADGRDLPDGEPGALLTRGPYTPRGYYRAPEQNARAFTPDGWYASGDVVRRRPDGNLVVEGRDKDMINRGGEKISAEEVENLLYRMPGIAQVAAVAAPDADLGERVCVFVVPEPGAAVTLDAIRDAMAAAGVAKFKWPERLELTAELPVTKVGKLDKKALRDLLP
jgi:non-ribosomal peptide synthetase component E (peptide arylation enzyme)